MKQLLVVDDDPQIVRLLRAYLEKAGYAVLSAADGESALHIIRSERPDLVVLDLMLPRRSGWEVTEVVRGDASLSDLPILMLTARVEDTDKIRGLEMGADDYITKPFNPSEIVARVYALLRRATGSFSPPRHLRAGPLLVDLDRHEVRRNGETVELTPTEFELLRTLMERAGHVFTRLELIEQALGYGYDGMERTLDSHIKNLRKKLESDPAHPQWIQTVYGVGYRLQDDEVGHLPENDLIEQRGPA